MSRSIVIPFFVICGLIIATFLMFENLEVFFSNLLHNRSGSATAYSLLSFLVLASDIVLPVPSSIVMYSNGYVLGTLYGACLSLLSLLLSCVAGYYLGRLTSLGVKKVADERTQKIIATYGSTSILITRGIPIISESVCIICGYNQMPFKTYFLLNLAGYLPLCFLYSFCGSMGYDENIFLISFVCSLLISAIFWLFGKYFLAPSEKTVNE